MKKALCSPGEIERFFLFLLSFLFASWEWLSTLVRLNFPLWTFSPSAVALDEEEREGKWWKQQFLTWLVCLTSSFLFPPSLPFRLRTIQQRGGCGHSSDFLIFEWTQQHRNSLMNCDKKEKENILWKSIFEKKMTTVAFSLPDTPSLKEATTTDGTQTLLLHWLL